MVFFAYGKLGNTPYWVKVKFRESVLRQSYRVPPKICRHIIPVGTSSDKVYVPSPPGLFVTYSVNNSRNTHGQ